MAAVTDLNSLLVAREGYRQGRPCLRGTGMTVHTLAAGLLRGATVQELFEENSDLDPSLIHAALAYYFANKEQIEADLERDAAEGAQLARQTRHGGSAEGDQER